MPASRLLARGTAAVGLTLLLTAVGTASAEKPASRAVDDARPNVMPSPFDTAAQHGGDTDHLPPVTKNMQLIKKFKPTSKGPVERGQITDVAVYKGFAYLNSGWDETSCPTRGGTFVIDVRDPANPKELGFLPAVANHYHGEGAHVITLNTPEFRGDVLALSNENCQQTSPTRGGGFDLWNVTDPAKPTRFVPPRGESFTFGDFGSGDTFAGAGELAHDYHSVFMWNSIDGRNAYLVGVDNDEVFDVDIYDITNPAAPVGISEQNLRTSPPWDETPNDDNAMHHDMVVKRIGDKMVMLNSYWDAGYVMQDVTDPHNPTYMADSDFGTSDPLTGFDPPEGNAHYAEFTNDNRFILTAEEDFAPARITSVTVEGVGTFEGSAVSGGGSPNDAPDGRMNGPMAYGGYACPDTNAAAGQSERPVPNALATFPTVEDGEERILVVQRGPSGDPNEDYNGNGDITDDACFPGDKAARAQDAGWDAILLTNRHMGSQANDSASCGSGGYRSTTPPLMTACTTHEALHRIFDDTPQYANADDETELVPIGTESNHKLNVVGDFDGWGYMSMYSTTPDENGKLPLVDAYAIPEALNPDYSAGFGDLSIHEQATDPTEPLSYSSYYSGGMRVFSYEGGKITAQGAFIDQDGSNFWGTEQFTAGDGERYIAGSDRDYGLYILRYTGPLAAKRPVCTDSAAMVPFKGSTTVPLTCTDANANNTLTRSVVANPAQGTVTNVNQTAGTVTYTHTGSTLGQDTFTFKANDGAADSAQATARVQIVPARGPRCFNPFAGTARAETIEGSAFGDRINAAGGNDVVNARQGGDCVTGGTGRDQLSGNLGNDSLFGGSARDRLFGESGRDRLSGGGGNDNLRGGSGNDRASGGAGFDRVDGGSDNDRLNGNGGTDRVYGGPGRDRLRGGSGKDRLDGGAATDRFSGGSGNDRIIADDGKKERIACGRGRDSVRADNKDVVASDCENVLRVRDVR